MEQAPSTPADQKALARKEASRIRKNAASAAPPDSAEQLAQTLSQVVDSLRFNTVSGFLPIGSEIDVRPALDLCRGRGKQVALPVVTGVGEPLLFRLWRPGDPLIKEGFGTMAPAPEAEIALPDLMLVPLLAFDRDGYRLGYGGGFYDRTIEKARSEGRPVTTIGVAYAAQEVKAVPRDTFDQPLDWIITPENAIPIKKRAGLDGAGR